MAELNSFGTVLQRILAERGMDAAELAALLREGGPDQEPAIITEEDIIDLMTAQPGEEFRRVADAVEAAFLSESESSNQPGRGLSWVPALSLRGKRSSPSFFMAI